MTRFGWKSWIVSATLVGAGAGLVTAARTPARYRSEALILVVPQRVPESYVRPTVTARLSDRLQSISPQILSRTTLERIIEDFDVYPEERQHALMKDVVDNMRKSVEIAPQSDNAFRVGFVGRDPRMVMKVTERLAALFIERSLQLRGMLAEGTNQFLQGQLEGLRTRLIRQKQQLNEARRTGSPQAETMAIES
jgi:uncharacterized protein involved in exopolysaccharide biosynthesis